MRLASRKDDAFTGPSNSGSDQNPANEELVKLPPPTSATDLGLFISLRRFEHFNTIAQLGGFFELEFFGGLTHGFFETVDELLALLGCHFFHWVFRFHRDGDVVALGD